jgi:uncharacterized protein (DUF362 family)
LSESVKVVAVKGEDKFILLEKALDDSGFLKNLNAKLAASGKSKTKFSIVIKPNLMMFTHREDPVATYTDPELVEHLVNYIRDQGYKNLKIVESQNCFGNWYLHREVLHVAQVAGFKPKDHGYKFIDLTEDSVPHRYNGRWLNQDDDIIGKAWRDADYRISFAKNKTHIEDYYTLTLKNVYGTNPMQDKMYEYHAKREWYGVTFDMLKAFHPDFGIIDAFYSSDGPLGFKGTFNPKPTKMILASPSLIAVDIIGSKMMGLKPKASELMTLCLEEWKEPRIDFSGNVSQDYTHPDWLNVVPRPKDILYPDALATGFTIRQIAERTPELLEIVVQGIATLFEEDYLAFSIGGILSSGISGDAMDPKEFPMKKWEDLTSYIQKQTIRNIKDLLSDRKRQRSIRWELKEFFRAVATFFERRDLSKQIDQAFDKWEKILE